MFIQLLILLVGLGAIYKLARPNICATACPRAPGGVCSCICGTCPCSALDAVGGVQETLQTYQHNVQDWIKTKVPALPVIPTVKQNAEPDTQFSRNLSSITLATPVVIERTHRASDSNLLAAYSAPGAEPGPSFVDPTRTQSEIALSALETSKDDPLAGRVPAVCNKCVAKGVTCMKICPKSNPVAISEPSNSSVCGKCKAKGATCMKSCPTAKSRAEGRVPAACGKCKARGVTCKNTCPNAIKANINNVKSVASNTVICGCKKAKDVGK